MLFVHVIYVYECVGGKCSTIIYLKFKSEYTYLFCVCVYMCMRVHAHVLWACVSPYACECQRATCRSQFSPSTMRVLGIKHRSATRLGTSSFYLVVSFFFLIFLRAPLSILYLYWTLIIFLTPNFFICTLLASIFKSLLRSL